MYRPILLTLATVASLGAGTLIAQGRAGAAPVVAHAVRTADARVDARNRIDDAVAAALIGRISQQFDTDDVTVQLGGVELAPLSERDREVQGTGRVRIGDDAQWIPIRFAALYDTVAAEVSEPRLQLGGTATGAADATMTRGLQARVADALATEFAGQPVTWRQGQASVSSADARIVRVTGTGVADFGAEGRVDARVDALYDRGTGRWLHVAYALGESHMDAGGAVASL